MRASVGACYTHVARTLFQPSHLIRPVDRSDWLANDRCTQNRTSPSGLSLLDMCLAPVIGFKDRNWTINLTNYRPRPTAANDLRIITRNERNRIVFEYFFLSMFLFKFCDDDVWSVLIPQNYVQDRIEY